MMEDRDYSEQTAQRIDDEVHRIVDECYDRARNILRKHTEQAKEIVNSLREKESLSSDEVKAILYRDKGVVQPETVAATA